jgi:WD40 repeat protein
MTVTTIANSEYTEVVEETLDSADNAQWEFTPRPEVTAADADSSSPQVLNSAVQSSTVVVPTYLSSLAHMQILLRYAVYSHPEILEATRAFKLGTPNWLLSPGVAISQLRFLAQQSSLTGNFPSFISGIASALVSGIEDAVSGQWIQWGQANSKDSSTSSVAAASSAASLSIVGQSANSQTGNVSPPVSRSASPDASQLNNSTLDHDFEEVGSPVSNATGGSVGLASDVRSQPSSFTPAGGIVYNAAGMSGNSDRVAALCGPRVFLPPSCRKYLMWGFADKSLRCYSCDEKGDRPIGVYDALHDGMITCAYVSDDGKLLVLGGDDCVVSVWDLIKIKHGRRLELKARLCGHLRPVTCVTVSATFGIVVSGSQDGSAIVWDLNRHAFTRHLSGHDGTVQCIAVNDATGDVITAAGTQLRIYTINGDLLVQKVVSPRACDAIRSVALSYAPEWVEQNVVVTGHRDGSIRFWSCTFSNIVTTTTTVSVRNERNVASKQSEKLRQIVSEEPEIAAVENEPAVAESGTDLNLSDDTKDTASFAAKVVNIRTKQLVTNVTSTNVKQTQMIVSGKLVRDLTLRARKIGHHTAVTALSLSADQQRLLSGDAQGVVLSWELPQDGITDHWIRDNDVEACASCRSRFTALNRRHHCRNCGRVMCGNCSSYRIELPDLHHLKPVRVCKDCYEFQLNVKRRKDGYQ